MHPRAKLSLYVDWVCGRCFGVSRSPGFGFFLACSKAHVVWSGIWANVVNAGALYRYNFGHVLLRYVPVSLVNSVLVKSDRKAHRNTRYWADGVGLSRMLSVLSWLSSLPRTFLEWWRLGGQTLERLHSVVAQWWLVLLSTKLAVPAIAAIPASFVDW